MVSDEPGQEGPKTARIWDLCALLVICLVAYHGIKTTADLSLPPDFDLYRDSSHAQTIADGGWLEDPFYSGESVWYSPLVPALVALISRAGEIPILTAYTRSGAYLNLLAPLAFYLLALHLFERPAALLSLLFFLFVPGLREDGLAPTYSPWLYSANFAQALFAVTLLCLLKACREPTLTWWVCVGLLLGLSFLAHTAPAVLLGFFFLCGSLGLLRRAAKRGRRAMRRAECLSLAAIAIAFLVSMPLLSSILFRYRLYVLNSAPSEYLVALLNLSAWKEFLLSFFSLKAGLSLVGFFFLVRERASRCFWWLIPAWAGACWLPIAWGFLRQWAAAGGHNLPNLIPEHHFLFYLGFLGSLLAGHGTLALANALRSRTPVPEHGTLWTLILAGLVFAASYPGYEESRGLAVFRARSLGQSRPGYREEVVAWIRENTAREAVFLAPQAQGILLVGPAGRKLVCMDDVFANPFVSPGPRKRAFTAMIQGGLKGGDSRLFLRFAREFGVRYALVTDELAEELSPRAAEVLSPIFRSEPITIFRVIYP